MAALKHLSSVLLKRKIQAGCGSSGHCSKEDAAAALSLALNRARIGDSFRLYDRPRRKNTIEEVTMLRRNNLINSVTPTGDRVSGASIGATEAPVVVLGPDEWLKAHFTSNRSSAHALRCENINSATSGALIAWLTSRQRQANLIWANLVVDEKDVSKAQAKVDGVIVSLFLPGFLILVRSLLSSIQLIPCIPSLLTAQDDIVRQGQGYAILFIFQSEIDRAEMLTKQKRFASDPRSTLGWSEDQEVKWKEAVDKCATSEALWVGMRT